MDTMVLQIVTVGQEATQIFDSMQSRGEYSEAYFMHGLAVQTAEATADYLHQFIRRELGIELKRESVILGDTPRFLNWKII